VLGPKRDQRDDQGNERSRRRVVVDLAEPTDPGVVVAKEPPDRIGQQFADEGAEVDDQVVQ
jgi:hypothetical protein